VKLQQVTAMKKAKLSAINTMMVRSGFLEMAVTFGENYQPCTSLCLELMDIHNSIKNENINKNQRNNLENA